MTKEGKNLLVATGFFLVVGVLTFTSHDPVTFWLGLLGCFIWGTLFVIAGHAFDKAKRVKDE